MTRILRELRTELQELRRLGLYRELEVPKGVDFCSNDYLGLSRDAALQSRILDRLQRPAQHPEDARISSPASRLLGGQTPHHDRLERRLSSFKGCPGALLYPSGYQANIGLITALAGRGDRVLSDRLNHASIIDGIRLSGCSKVIYPHLDVDSLEEALRVPFPHGRTFIVTESLFSMDGDMAPLDRYVRLAKRYDAELIVDDAHATGLYGEQRGSGLVEHFGVEEDVLAVVSTFGKAVGLSAAFVAGAPELIDYLINRSRTFIFTTAVPPLLLHALEAALDWIEENPQLRRRALAMSQRLRSRLQSFDLPATSASGPIVPVVLGESGLALQAAQDLRRAGYYVRAVRPPTVPQGTSRLRISVHADHSEEEIDGLAAAIGTTLALAEQRT